MKDQLLKLPELIKEKSIEILELNQELQEQESKFKILETSISAEISAETDSQGKPKFSNDSKRKDEFNLRISMDDNYKGLESKLKKLRDEYQRLIIDQEFLLNTQKNLRALCYFNDER